MWRVKEQRGYGWKAATRRENAARRSNCSSGDARDRDVVAAALANPGRHSNSVHPHSLTFVLFCSVTVMVVIVFVSRFCL